MSTEQVHEDGTAGRPVACTLTLADQAGQAGRWRQAARQAMTGRAHTADGIRVTFRADQGVEESVRQLAAVESECCGWATWAVDGRDGELTVVVSSATGEGVDTLHQMLDCFWPQQRR